MKVAVGMPIADTMPGEVVMHHMATIIEIQEYCMKTYGVGVVAAMIPGLSPHDLARHEIVKNMLEMGIERLFMMDDDTITPRGGFVRLMQAMDAQPCAAMSGYYLRRGNPYTSVWTAKLATDPEGTLRQVESNGGIHELYSSGLGCCLIDLAWCKAHLPPSGWFKMEQKDDYTVVTDDAVFFKNIREANGKILGNADVTCVHIGRREWIMPETATFLRLGYDALEKARMQIMFEAKPLKATKDGVI